MLPMLLRVGYMSTVTETHELFDVKSVEKKAQVTTQLTEEEVRAVLIWPNFTKQGSSLRSSPSMFI